MEPDESRSPRDIRFHVLFKETRRATEKLSAQMREKQEEPIAYMLSLLSNQPMHHPKSATACDCPGGLHGAQVAKMAMASRFVLWFYPSQQPNPRQLLPHCPTSGMGKQIKRVKLVS